MSHRSLRDRGPLYDARMAALRYYTGVNPESG
jgi:hypothetical protein